jgi:hypothetical protein
MPTKFIVIMTHAQRAALMAALRTANDHALAMQLLLCTSADDAANDITEAAGDPKYLDVEDIAKLMQHEATPNDEGTT